MNLDKISKIIWITIGSLVLLGIVVMIGGISWGVLSSRQHYPTGVEVQTGKDGSKERNYIIKTVYEMPLITEGSEYIIVPVGLKKASKLDESDGYLSRAKAASSWDSSYSRLEYIGYNYFNGPCHNLVFINKKTGQSGKLLSERAYIDAVYFPEKKTLGDDKARPEFVLLKIAKKDTNGDGIINHKDAVAAYLVGLDGKNLTQITPQDDSMVSWRYDAESKKLFIKVLEDVDQDRKFTEEDKEKILVVDTQSPGIGKELVSAETKKEIDAVMQL